MSEAVKVSESGDSNKTEPVVKSQEVAGPKTEVPVPDKKEESSSGKEKSGKVGLKNRFLWP